MENLKNEAMRHLSDDVIMQLSRQIGAQDANNVKRATQGIVEILVDAISRNAQNQESGGGLYGAIKKDHDGGILGDLLGVLGGQKKVENPKTMNGTGIINHLLGKRQLEAAQVVSQMSGIDIFKSGVLMQLIAPVVIFASPQKSSGLDLGGLAKILMGGGQTQQSQGSPAGGLLGKLLDRDGDGSMMDDLLNMGMQILKK